MTFFFFKDAYSNTLGAVIAIKKIHRLASASIVVVGFPKSQQPKPDFVLQQELEFSTS